MRKPTKTIAITGATGFVGSHLVRFFSQRGFDVIAIGRQNKPPLHLLRYAKWVVEDITQPMKDIDADIVIHAAGKASDNGTYSEFEKTNIDGTRNVLNASKNCKNFVFISSSSIYAENSNPILESQAKLSSSLSKYGKSKLLAEELLINECKCNKLLILRPRAIYGTHDRILLPRLLRLVKKRRLLLPGSLNILTSMTSIQNLAYAIEQLLLNEEANGVYNVSDSKPYNLRYVVTSLINSIYGRDLSNHEIPISFLNFIAKVNDKLSISSSINSHSLGYMKNTCTLDISKLKSTIDYSKSTVFENRLSDISKWVNLVGIDKVKQANPNLCWDHDGY